jgi:hypothetical protein
LFNPCDSAGVPKGIGDAAGEIELQIRTALVNPDRVSKDVPSVCADLSHSTLSVRGMQNQIAEFYIPALHTSR